MSHAPTMTSRHEPRTLRASGLVFTLAAAVTGLAAGLFWSGLRPGVAAQDSAAVPSAPAPAAASTDTTVPPASKVFGHKEVAVEEPAPTF